MRENLRQINKEMGLLLEENPEKEREGDSLSSIERKIIFSLNGQLSQQEKESWKEYGFKFFLDKEMFSEEKLESLKENITERIEESEKIFVGATSMGLFLSQLRRMQNFLVYSEVDPDFNIVETLKLELESKNGRPKNTAGLFGEIYLAKRYFDKEDGMYSLLRNAGAENLGKLFKKTDYFGLKEEEITNEIQAKKVLQNAINQITSLLNSDKFQVLDPANRDTWK